MFIIFIVLYYAKKTNTTEGFLLPWIDGYKAIGHDRFGRSKYFCIYDLNSKTSGFIKNKYTTEPDGVGKHVVDILAEYNVHTIISCEFGRKVRTLLEKQKIQMVIVHNVSLTGEEI